MSGSDQEQSAAGRRVTWIAVVTNAALVAIKVVAGVFGGSQALIADAIHSVSDFFTDAVVLVGLRMGRRGPDEDHHFGHGRMETMASAIVGLALLAVAAYLSYDAIADIIGGAEHHPTWLALAAAGISIVVNEVLYQMTIRVGRRIGSSALVANAWHHRSDALSSVAVFVGVGGAQLNPRWFVLDSVATVAVALLVAKVGIDVVGGAVREMVDTAPPTAVLDRLRHSTGEVQGVLGTHDLKVRSVGGRYHVQVHIEVDGTLTVLEGHDIADAVSQHLRDGEPAIVGVIVHVDPYGATSDLPTML